MIDISSLVDNPHCDCLECQDTQMCPYCDGSGILDSEKCTICKGSGKCPSCNQPLEELSQQQLLAFSLATELEYDITQQSYYEAVKPLLTQDNGTRPHDITIAVMRAMIAEIL